MIADTSEDSPLGAEGQEWLERKIEQLVRRGYSALMGPHASDETRRELVAWYAEHWRDYVCWEDSDYFYPEDGGARGLWRFLTAKAERDMGHAMAETMAARHRRAVEEERARVAVLYPTVDAWLAAASAGTLPVCAPHERSAGDLLPEEQHAAYCERRNRMQDRWPRLCKECGSEFRPERRHGVRCLECRRQRKAKDGQER